MQLSKKQKAIRAIVTPGQIFNVESAVDTLKKFASDKFKNAESIDIAVNLGIDPKKSDQAIRGAINLPAGTGKCVRVAVFAQGDNAVKATAAGADIVGFEDLAEQIKQGNLDFDVVVATPDAMRIVGQLGQILGPRGLMPNPKVGTVTANIENAVKNVKSGQIQFKTDKNGIIHSTVGKVNFTADQIFDNVKALITELKRVKPASAKGVYIKKITLSSTMGPGLVIDISSLSV